MEISEADWPVRESVAKSDPENHPETRASALPRFAAKNHAGDPGVGYMAMRVSDHIAATSKNPPRAWRHPSHHRPNH